VKWGQNNYASRFTASGVQRRAMVQQPRNTAATLRAFRYRQMVNVRFFSTSELAFVISVSNLLKKMQQLMPLH
jgi:hypothetical protein